MGRVLLIVVVLTFGGPAISEEASFWKLIELPGVQEVSYLLVDPWPVGDEYRMAVFFRNVEPKLSDTYGKELWRSEIQEWHVDCESLEGDIRLVRYSTSDDPNDFPIGRIVEVQDFLAVAREKLEVVCEFAT